jgi:hypothetical protein
VLSALPLGLVLPVLAQRADERQHPQDVNPAKEIVKLIEQGQLNLVDATKLAEKHAGGHAIRVNCEIRAGGQRPEDAQKPAQPGKPGGPSAQVDEPTGKRLIYDITVAAKERVQMVQVDGLTKKVVPSGNNPSQP